MKNTALLLVSLMTMSVWAENELPPGVDRRMYCETCLATVQELKKALQLPSHELSRSKLKSETSKVCETLTFETKGFSVYKTRSACKHLLDLYGDKFEEVFLTEKVETLEANLCYLHTTACTGVRRQHFQEQKLTFEDGIIEEFIQKHADRVRRSKPKLEESSDSFYNAKEEL